MRVCLNESYYLYFSLLEQSSDLFQKPGKSRNFLFCLPLSFLLLSNVYKGDNITNLTLEPSLVPFDTFNSLIQNNFKIFSRRCGMPDDRNGSIFGKTLGLKTKYVRESEHEAYPIISEIWHSVLSTLTFGDMNRLSVLKHQISNRTMMYLNHSEMLPEWKTELGEYGEMETTDEILSMHMESCNRSIIILFEILATELHTNLQTQKKPSYSGKDILMENTHGFQTYGYFPPNLKLRLHHGNQLEIVEWWQKYIKWYLVLRNELKVNGMSNHSITMEETKSGVYVLSIIPAAGLLLAIVVFVVYECNALKIAVHLAWLAIMISTKPKVNKQIKTEQRSEVIEILVRSMNFGELTSNSSQNADARM